MPVRYERGALSDAVDVQGARRPRVAVQHSPEQCARGLHASGREHATGRSTLRGSATPCCGMRFPERRRQSAACRTTNKRFGAIHLNYRQMRRGLLDVRVATAHRCEPVLANKSMARVGLLSHWPPMFYNQELARNTDMYAQRTAFACRQLGRYRIRVLATRGQRVLRSSRHK